MFIIIEGADGSSKNTQAQFLANFLESKGYRTLTYAFPRDSLSGRAARECIQIEKVKTTDSTFNKAYLTQCAMTVDRFEFLAQLRKNEADKIITIAVRWSPSALVYGAIDGCQNDWLEQTQAELPIGNINILLDIKLETAMDRIERRMRTKERYETAEFQKLAIKRYREMWRKKMKGHTHLAPHRWLMVDANRTKETIARDVQKQITPYLADFLR